MCTVFWRILRSTQQEHSGINYQSLLYVAKFGPHMSPPLYLTLLPPPKCCHLVCFEKGSTYIVQGGLELAMSPRLALNSQQFAASGSHVLRLQAWAITFREKPTSFLLPMALANCFLDIISNSFYYLDCSTSQSGQCPPVFSRTGVSLSRLLRK